MVDPADKRRLQIVQQALRKRAAGKPLGAAEAKAIERYERDQIERNGLIYIEKIPKFKWRDWSGRQTKMLHSHADMYGIPIRDVTIRLPAVVRWLHDWLSDNHNELAGLQNQSGEGKTGSLRSKKLEQQIILLRQQNKILEQELAEKLGRVIPVEKMHRILSNAAKPLRAAGDRLRKRYGQEAGDILTEALEDFDNILEKLISEAEEEATEECI